MQRSVCTPPGAKHWQRPIPRPHPFSTTFVARLCFAHFSLAESADLLRIRIRKSCGNERVKILMKMMCKSCGKSAENLWIPRGEAVEKLVDFLCESGGEAADNTRNGSGRFADLTR
jgi:hypothetical protein